MKETQCFGQPKKINHMETKETINNTFKANARHFVLDTINEVQRFKTFHNLDLDNTINALFGLFDTHRFDMNVWNKELEKITKNGRTFPSHKNILCIAALCNKINICGSAATGMALSR